MLKKDARKMFRQKREAITYQEKTKWDDLILIQFQSIEFPYLDSLLTFYPMEDRNEVNTFLLSDYLHFKNPNLRICYPRTDFSDHSMQAIVCHADTIFEASAINLPEPVGQEVLPPEKIDMVIVPQLICDRKGHRVGYGKGFYDRYLSKCRKDCIKVGLSYFPPIDTIDDKGEFDVPLNFCITPERTYVF